MLYHLFYCILPRFLEMGVPSGRSEIGRSEIGRSEIEAIHELTEYHWDE